MRQFIYKTVIIIFGLIIAYEFTIGKTISKFEQKADLVLSKEGRKSLVISVKKKCKKLSIKRTILQMMREF